MASDKLAGYQQFADERHMPVFIVLGVGGEPCQPELLYNIPLKEIPLVFNSSKSIRDFLRPSTESPFMADEFISLKEKSKVNTLEEIRAKYPNAYRPWTKKANNSLATLYKSGKSIEELTLLFQRNNGAITSRLRKLGMIE